MAKLYFRYGTVDSSKTARLLMDAYEYEKRGEFVLLIKPSTDTRSPKGKIVSRTGLSADCIDIDKDFNIYEYVKSLIEAVKKPACIFVDEAQFLTFAQVVQLRYIANDAEGYGFNIPVMCYGLKTDFRGLLFEGSKALFQYANRFEEVKTICREQGCKNKAMFNVRFKNGEPVFEGEQVLIGDTKEEKDKYYYVPKCSEHFFADWVKYDIKRRELHAE